MLEEFFRREVNLPDKVMVTSLPKLISKKRILRVYFEGGYLPNDILVCGVKPDGADLKNGWFRSIYGAYINQLIT